MGYKKTTIHGQQSTRKNNTLEKVSKNKGGLRYRNTYEKGNKTRRERIILILNNNFHQIELNTWN